MTQEEKAKAYDKVLEKANALYKAAEPMSGCNVILEIIFPELKESEDEKIRKVLTDYFKDYKSQEEFGVSTFFGVPTDNILAWLKKQGEQKPTVIIPKFRVGDEIKTPNEESLTITKIDEKGYWSEDLFICRFDDADKWELVEQKDSVVDFKAEDWYVSKVDGKIYNAKFMEQNSCKKTTRRGEIEKAAFSTSGIIEQTDWFIKGAEWADEHPYCNWLEKQGEQKHFDYENANIQQKNFAPQKDIPHYSIGDVLCDKSCTMLNKESQSNFEITDIRNGMYICDKCSFPISQQDEYELVAKRIESAWSEKDEENFRDIVGAIHAVAYQTTEDEESRLEWLYDIKQRMGG